MILSGTALNSYLKKLIVPEAKMNSRNNYPSEAKAQSRRANSKWLATIINSGRFNSMYRTINVVTFIPSRTNDKEPIVILGQTTKYMRDLAFSGSPGKKYLNDIKGLKTTTYAELRACVLGNPEFNSGWKNMISEFDMFISLKVFNSGLELREFYANVYEKLKNALDLKDRVSKGAKQNGQKYLDEIFDPQMKKFLNQQGRYLDAVKNPDIMNRMKTGILNKVNKSFGINIKSQGITSTINAVASKTKVGKVAKVAVNTIKKIK